METRLKAPSALYSPLTSFACMFEECLKPGLAVWPDVLTYPRSQELPNARVILQAIRLALDSLVITRAWSFSTEAVLSILTSGNNYFPTFVNLTPIPVLPPILTLFSFSRFHFSEPFHRQSA